MHLVYEILTKSSKTLKLLDDSNAFKALVVSHMSKTIAEFWKTFVTRITALYGEKFVVDSSDRPGYDYMAIHYHYYNRYGGRVRFIFLFVGSLKQLLLIHRVVVPLQMFTLISLRGKGPPKLTSLSVLPTNQKKSPKTLRSGRC